MDDTDATSRDTSRHVATPYDPLRHTLTVHEVELQLSAAGVGRTPRTIQRLCENKVFDAARLGGNNEWFVAPDSVPKVIADLRAHDDLRLRRVATLRDTSRHDAPEKGLNSENDMTRHDATRRDMSAAENLEKGAATPNDTSRHDATQPDTSRYVGQLETRIEEKDAVIGMLRGELDRRNEEIVRRNERERETNILIRGLQNLVLRLQAPSSQPADVLDEDPAPTYPQPRSLERGARRRGPRPQAALSPSAY